jgi:hypothetical protein
MSNTDNKETVSVPVFFRAIDRFVETNIVAPTESKGRGDKIVWGDNNGYPSYLMGLYKDVATLGSIVNGSVDYVAGNDVKLASPLFPEGKMNPSGQLAVDIVRGCALDWFIFGGFAHEIIRGADGKPAAVNNIGIEDLRTNDDVNVFWWCNDWSRGRDVKTYPAFMPDLDWFALTDEERDRHAASILYVKNTVKQVYPQPLYAQAVKACETERSIDVFHLNSIKNGFAASAFIELCNGVPTEDSVKAEIERMFTEKFGGETNAGRIMLSFSPDRQHSAVIHEMKTDDFGNRYDALAKRCRQQIFTSFRANPNLFGIPTDNLGFSAEEYQQAFDLFNRTQIVPVQARIVDAFDRICGAQDVLTIEPFSMNDSEASVSLAAQLGVGGTQSLMLVLESTTMTTEQKLGVLETLFAFDEESAHKVLGLPYTPVTANDE